MNFFKKWLLYIIFLLVFTAFSIGGFLLAACFVMMGGEPLSWVVPIDWMTIRTLTVGCIIAGAVLAVGIE